MPSSSVILRDVVTTRHVCAVWIAALAAYGAALPQEESAKLKPTRERGPLDALTDRTAYAKLDSEEVGALAVAAQEHWPEQFATLEFIGVERFAAGKRSHWMARWRHMPTTVEFMLLPGGSFNMGSPEPEGGTREDQDLDRDEQQHRVSLAPFLIARTECTQEQWLGLAVREGLKPDPSAYEGARRPVEQVSARDAEAWCHAAGLALPTEAQWEYAARAGTTTSYTCGKAAVRLEFFANLADASTEFEWKVKWDDGFADTAPVASFRPNAFGLYDVHGNVWEWCRDDYLGYGFAVDAGTGARLGSSGLRAARGGSYRGSVNDVRSAFRFGSGPERAYPFLGFRPVLDLP